MSRYPEGLLEYAKANYMSRDTHELAAGVEKEFGYKMNPKTMQSLKTRLQSQMYGYSHIYSYGSRPMEMFLRVA